MPIFATAFLIKSAQTPLIALAGALTALVLGFGVFAWRRGLGRALVGYGLPVAAVAAVLLLAGLLIDVVAGGEQSAHREALLKRAAELDRSVLMPGSILPCVDGAAGEAVGNACEKTVFGSARSTAAAVAYMASRIDLLKEARALTPGDDGLLLSALAGTRRTVALDRYGLAAHVLAERDGCTATRCAIFVTLDHAGALKSNLKAQAFDQYVSRYAASWNEPTPASPKAAVASVPSTPVASALPAAAPDIKGTRAAIRPGEPWDFPSADSIPAVSIVTPEPKLTKDAAARLAEGVKKAQPPKTPAEPKAREARGAGDKSKNPAEKTPSHPQPGAPLPLR
ncbi:MAG TPA: hypothetical protein VFT69_02285 [Pseudolabrys sp.]|nr:hypothetical protein [Pseudolabrys sp.]